MIDWGFVLGNAFWLLGLALALTGVSFALYGYSWAQRVDLPIATWINLGGMTFCLGVALTTSSWLERGIWSVLCLGWSRAGG